MGSPHVLGRDNHENLRAYAMRVRARPGCLSGSCRYERAGSVYSLYASIRVPKRLAGELTSATKLQADLFLRPNEDGLFPGFTQTWRSEG
jgi:hypothetical protein